MAEHCSPGFCLCDCPCLLALGPWRWSTRHVGVLSSGWCPDWDPRQRPGACGVGGATRPRKQAPGEAGCGPWQYHTVHQYSGVRRAWGPGGLPVFLIFGASGSRPLRIHNLMDVRVILTAPVRCIADISPISGRPGGLRNRRYRVDKPTISICPPKNRTIQRKTPSSLVIYSQLFPIGHQVFCMIQPGLGQDRKTPRGVLLASRGKSL